MLLREEPRQRVGCSSSHRSTPVGTAVAHHSGAVFAPCTTSQRTACRPMTGNLGKPAADGHFPRSPRLDYAACGTTH